jgi:outer membrane receptor for ferrienterochelin and colicin
MRLFFLFVGLIACSSLFAQSKFTVSGVITEKGSGETLPGVTVMCIEQELSTVTNNYGFYSLTLNGDSATVLIRYTGYIAQAFKVKAGASNKLNVDLIADSDELAEVVISAEQQRKISEETQMSAIEIPIDQIKKIPAFMGEKDVLKVIQLLPGVQKGSEGSSGLYVRGGGPDQNLIILDDAVVYNANHLFGFFSIFNGDALKSVELIKGGFPARYGGRLSSVLEMQMKDGNKEELHGEIGIGVIASRATLEGPIKKGKSSFIVSARRTYIDALVYPFLPTDEKVGYYFYDFNAKANFILDDKNRLYVSGYFGKDKFYFRPKYDDGSEESGEIKWGNATATMRLNHIVSDKIFSNTSLIFSKYNFGIGFETIDGDDSFSLDFKSGIRDWTVKHDVDYRPGANHYIRMGASSSYHRFSPSAIVVKSSDVFENEQEVDNIDCLESGVYIEDDWTISKKFKANFGIRGSHFLAEGNKSYFGFEPRFGGRYLLKPDLSVKASYALMNQYLHLLSNSGIGLPTDLWVPATANVKPQRSQQVALGVAKDLDNPRLTITVEGYYKKMKNIIGYKEGASFLMIGEFGSTEKVNWEDNVTSGEAESYGAEVLVQRKFGKLTGWVGYTLSWTTMQFDELNNGEKFFARYDRRHDLSIVGIYELDEGLTLAATWVYGTGQAVTLPLANYTTVLHDPQSGPSSSLNNSYYTMYSSSDYGGKNEFRMAPYHRLDLSAQWHKKLKRCERTFELSVYNTYNRKNPYFYQIGTNSNGDTILQQISLFPILPSVSWTFKF